MASYSDRKYKIQALAIGACIILLVIYALWDPSRNLFPRCPFLALTGLECPGCGSQRAVHALLHGNISTAFGFNPLMIILLPYLAVCAYLELLGGKRRFPKARRILMGQEACLILLMLFIIFFVIRNFVL